MAGPAGGAEPPPPALAPELPDLSDLKGQLAARRALEIAAAGRHSLLLSGPPGTGKSMLATRLPGILPAMSETEALEVASVRSLASGGLDPTQFWTRPIVRRIIPPRRRRWWRRRPAASGRGVAGLAWRVVSG